MQAVSEAGSYPYFFSQVLWQQLPRLRAVPDQATLVLETLLLNSWVSDARPLGTKPESYLLLRTSWTSSQFLMPKPWAKGTAWDLE